MSSRAERKKRSRLIEDKIKQAVAAKFEEAEKRFNGLNKSRDSLDYLHHLQTTVRKSSNVIANNIQSQSPCDEISLSQLKSKIEIEVNLLILPKINNLKKQLGEKGLYIEEATSSSNTDESGRNIFGLPGNESMTEILLSEEKRMELIQSNAMKWGFSIELNKAIIFFTDDPEKPMVADRFKFAEKLVQEVKSLNLMSRMFFFMALEASLKLYVMPEQHNKIPEIISIFKQEVEEIKISA